MSLPSDPPGWEVRLTEDWQWQPVALFADVTLDSYPTKQEAVEEISAYADLTSG